MEDQEYRVLSETQKQIKSEAFKRSLFRPLISPSNKAARFPGFHQGVRTYKAGQQVEKGALRLPIDIVLHESVSMVLDDGTKLYTDIFLPSRFQSLDAVAERRVPALVVWSPYGKQKGTTLLDDFPFRAGVPKHWLSGLQKWEGPDPAFWCAHDYAVVNVDTRGSYTSEGDLLLFGHQEAEDGAQFINWVSKQPWCNGKVALTGNSWLAIAQWKIASLRPEGLAAIAPWEGFSDFYKHHLCAGGIPFVGFHDDIARTLAGQGKQEDPVQYLKQQDLFDVYWQDKVGHPERINVPTYVGASWTNPVHTSGTLKAWSLLPKSVPTWLRVHNKMEWPDYYDDDSKRDLKRFFDYYLHGKTDNGWQTTPKVRLSVLNTGITGIADIVNRPEAEFPLARTRYVKYYLCPDKTLALQPPATGIIQYDSSGEKLVFEHQMSTSLETTGFFMAHLIMSSPQHNEMDVFVQVERFSSNRSRQGTLCIKPQSSVACGLLKIMHDWQIGLGSAGMAFHWGPEGQLRASHALGKVKKDSLAQPEYTHTEKQPLREGEQRTMDIPMRPYGLFWEKGDYLRFTVSGKMINPFPIPGLKMHETDNRGNHVIHCGGHGKDSSYLLLPVV